MAQNVKIAGAIFPDVPAIRVPDDNDVYHAFTDVSDTTAAAADVAQGKLFFDALGVLTTGTASGGGGGGLESESGIWTPAEDISHGEISFSRTHEKYPLVAALWTADGAWPTQTQTGIGAIFLDIRQLLGGVDGHYSESTTVCGISRYYYVSSKLSGNIGTSVSWNKDYMSSLENTNSVRFFVTESMLRPYADTRYWRASTAYKWIAIWL